MYYTVKEIAEDIDYGCEERPDDLPVLAIVTLIGDDGSVLQIKTPDWILYDRKINEGSRVFLDNEGLPETVAEKRGQAYHEDSGDRF